MARRIYAYTSPSKPGLIKVGQTESTAEARVKSQTSAAVLEKLEIVMDEPAVYVDGSGEFTDKHIHHRLEKAGFARVRKNGGEGAKSEWFEVDVDTVRAAYLAETQRAPLASKYSRHQNFSPRDEQNEAVERTIAEFARAHQDGRKGRMLWDAKMRFGKTFSTYKLSQRESYQRILIATFMPSVGTAWESDLMSHVDFEGWRFVRLSDSNLNAELEKEGPLVVFGSFQDLLGKTRDEKKEIKHKNRGIHATTWDLLVLDEYHHGSWREQARDLFESDKDTDDQSIQFDERNLPISAKNTLFLSGTAFRALNSGEFNENQVFTWSYLDEQRAKRDWNPERGENPYSLLPEMVMATYQLGESLTNRARNTDNQFDLSAFFAVKKKDEASDPLPKDATPQFLLHVEVEKFLRIISGREKVESAGPQKAIWPFAPGANQIFGDLRHTFWLLPDVASCYAMAELLRNDAEFQRYSIVVAAGPEAGMGEEALKPVRAAITEKDTATRTITLSCRKLTTGVTIPEWTAVLMLRNLSAAETYLQAAFRAQSPHRVSKKRCFVFDFSPHRALNMIAELGTSQRSTKNGETSNPEKDLSEFMEMLPVLAWDGNSMRKIDAVEVLDFVTSGTSATMLARRWESALLVNMDNNVLNSAIYDAEAMEAIGSIQGFRRLNQTSNELKKIINQQDSVAELTRKVNQGTATSKEKQKLSQEQKNLNKTRKEWREKLIKFATRVPLFMYLSDHRELSLRDVIERVEPDLFESATGLTTAQFRKLVDIGLFNQQVMNDAVYRFKRYEDASLNYLNLEEATDKEKRKIGLFETTISKDDAKLAYGS